MIAVACASEPDRLARNFDHGGKVIGLFQRGVIQEIRTFAKTRFQDDNLLAIAVEFGMANQYVRDLSVNIQPAFAKNYAEHFPWKSTTRI